MSDFEGIVLKSTALNDHDVLLNVLTEQGKVSIKAKGLLKINSKNRNMCEIGCHSLFHTIDRMNQQVLLLKNAESCERYKNIRSDLEKQGIYNCILEIFFKSDISMKDALHYIHLLDVRDNPYIPYCLLLSQLIRESGIGLVVDECVSCHDTRKLCGFSFDLGGFVCVDCINKASDLKLSAQRLRDIRYCMHASLKDDEVLQEVSQIDFEISDLLVSFIHRYGEFTIQAHRFMKELIEVM